MSNVFFTSDEHYEHRNIIEYCNRPFKTVEEMTETLVANHNSKVQKGDLTCHLGDIFWRTMKLEAAIQILDKLNGQHVFIRGNHDEVLEKLAKAGHRKLVGLYDVKKIKPRSQYPAIWLSHYAHRVWPASHKGSWHAYGHTHAVLPDFRYSHDVGVDMNGYYPISIDEFAQLMYSKDKLQPDEVQQDMLDRPWLKGER